jgi:hypothetical protein
LFFNIISGSSCHLRTIRFAAEAASIASTVDAAAVTHGALAAARTTEAVAVEPRHGANALAK